MALKFNPLISIGLDDTGNDADAAAGGSDTQIQYNNGGALAGSADLTWDDSAKRLGVAGQINISLAGAASTPPASFTGSWFTGGTATTTKPQLLIEPTGTTSTAWSTSGTGLGVNAASGFGGNLLDLQVNGTSTARVDSNGTFRTSTDFDGRSAFLYGGIYLLAGDIHLNTGNGTKIGTATTQKLGFYNATPVVQPTAVADATDAASVITQLNALLSRMRDIGLIAT